MNKVSIALSAVQTLNSLRQFQLFKSIDFLTLNSTLNVFQVFFSEITFDVELDKVLNSCSIMNEQISILCRAQKTVII